MHDRLREDVRQLGIAHWPDEGDDPFQEITDAERHRDEREYGLGDERPQREALDDPAEEDREHDDERQTEVERQAGLFQHRVGEPGRNKDDLAEGQVGDAARLPDEGETERDERIDEADGDAGDGVLEIFVSPDDAYGDPQNGI